MPFIKQDGRDVLDPFIDALNTKIQEQGHVAYAVYRLVKREHRYTAISRARAILHDVLDILDQEYLHYEHNKREENGAIYD